jgi:hypothetical protein
MAVSTGFNELHQNWLAQKSPAAYYGRSVKKTVATKSAVYRGESLTYFLLKNGVDNPVNSVSKVLSLNKIGDPRELVAGIELLLP